MAELESLLIGNELAKEAAEETETSGGDNELTINMQNPNLPQSGKRRVYCLFETGGGEWTRTTDLRIMRPSL